MPDTVMVNEYFEIKDKCRKSLLKYLSDALSTIPRIDKPEILDIGCGTGVTTIWLAENYDGIITAVDIDKKPLDWLQEKIKRQNLESRIKTINKPFFDVEFNEIDYDIILAEGFLNVVGFEWSFPEIIKLLKINRFFVIHDEDKDQKAKCELIAKSNCKLLRSFMLDEHVWWNDYYAKLEDEMHSERNRHLSEFFKPDMQEIELYSIDPTQFRSMYYIIEK
jgi:ubiquinone/menaquinone biosynthesis C-methylase UbiE